jgi:superfamily II DNA helicase RecQ
MDVFTYLPELCVFVCCLCKQVISSEHVQEHVRTQQVHKLRNHSHRVREFRELFQQYPLRLRDINQLRIPGAPIPLIPQLSDPEPGYRCRSKTDRCQYVCRNLRTMQTHSREVHDWEPPRKRGRPHKQSLPPSISNNNVPWIVVATQRFMPKGPLSRFFEVRSVIQTINETLEPSSDQQYADKRESIQQQIQQLLQHGHEKMTDKHLTDVNPWLDMVGWAVHLQAYQHHRSELQSLLTLPQEDIDLEGSQGEGILRRNRSHRPPNSDFEQLFDNANGTLAVMCSDFNKIIQVGQHTMMEKVNWAVRHEINKNEPGKEEPKPFQANLLPSTMKRYRSIWKQLICYIVRSMVLQQQGAEVTDESSDLDDVLSDESALSHTDNEEQPFPSQARFRFTENQQERYQEMWDLYQARSSAYASPYQESEGSERLGPTQQALLRFLISLLNHRISGNDFENAILSGLAVLGLGPVQGWVDALNYTPKLSAVVKLARIMVVQLAWETTDGSPDHDIFNVVKNSVRRYMVIGAPTPMSRIYHMRTYGLKIRYTTTAAGRVDWTGQGQQTRLLFEKIEFSKAQFEGFVRGVLQEARRILQTNLLYTTAEDRSSPEGSIPLIPWDTLRDDPSSMVPGWNFTQDQRTQWPIERGEWWLWDRIQRQPVLREQLLRNHRQTGPQHFQKGSLREWLLYLRRFKEHLLILVHICGGQPPRASEILSLKHSNSTYSRRNFFIEDSMVVYVTEYHKGYSISGSVKIIHRYLPREVGELIVYYIWLVLPFERQIIVDELQALALSPFMWSVTSDLRKDQFWQVNDMTSFLQSASTKWMGSLGKLSVSSYRHCAIALSRRFCGEDGFTEEVRDEEEQEEDETTWYSPQDNAQDLQAGHGTHVAGMIYARGLHEASGVIASLRARFRRESLRWHSRVLGFTPVIHDHIIRKRLHTAVSEQEQKRQRQQARTLQKVDILAQLRRLMGPSAQFRGLQQQAIEAIMNGQDIICVMGTGAGKSLLFLLPAFYQSNTTTVVIVPTIALREDMIRRCTENGISCHQWVEGPPVSQVQVLLVTPESSFTNKFHGYLHTLQHNGSLTRVVIDECHVVLDSTLEYRPLLQEFVSFLRFGVQMVYLTATLPPEEQSQLYELLRIDPNQVRLIRASTSRRNIQYQVHQHNGKETSLIAFIHRELQRCQELLGSLIVYSSKIHRAQELATQLGCPVYHSRIAPAERTRIYQQLLDGTNNMVVATNGLGVGIDVPNIYCVIHAEVPYKLRDYAQESGRAGRDGKPSRSIIIQYLSTSTSSEWRLAPSHHRHQPLRNGGETQMISYCRGDRCRRVILDEYLDGEVMGLRERLQCEANEANCDVCEQRESLRLEQQALSTQEEAEQEARDRRRQDWQDQIRNMEMTSPISTTEIEILLAHWHGKCSICHLQQGRGTDSNHTLEQCPRPERIDVLSEFQQLRTNIKYANYSGCFQCAVPQAICQKFTPNPSGRGGFLYRPDRHCQYPDTVLSVVIAIMGLGRKEWRLEICGWMTHDKVDPNNEAAITKWYGQKVKWGGNEMSMIMKVFCVLVMRAGSQSQR